MTSPPRCVGSDASRGSCEFAASTIASNAARVVSVWVAPWLVDASRDAFVTARVTCGARTRSSSSKEGACGAADSAPFDEIGRPSQ